MKQAIVNLAKKYVPHDLRMFLRRLNWKRLYLVQSGSNGAGVYCPIEERSYTHFIRHKGDRLSPGNGAHSRQRLVWHFLKHEIGILEKKLRVLHVAPELAFMVILKDRKNLEYFPGDKMVAGYSDQKGVRNIDLTALEFPDRSFDLVICNHVLEHIPDDLAAMREIHRVLAPGGKAVITVPIDEKLDRTYEDPSIVSPADRRKHFGQWDHVRFYALDIADRLESTGLKAEIVRYGSRFSKAEYEKFGFCDDPIFVATKPESDHSS